MLVMKAFLLLILRTPIGKNISLAMAAYKSKKQLGSSQLFYYIFTTFFGFILARRRR